MKKYIVSLLACTIFVSCTHEEIPGPDSEAPGAFIANVENIGTKTSLSPNNFVFWQADDQVAIFDNTTLGTKYKVASGTEGSTSCNLVNIDESSDDFTGGTELAHKIAIYPYSESLACIAKTDGSYSISNITISENQTYAEDSFAYGAFPMVAVSGNQTLSFKNICGAISLDLMGTCKVTSISIRGNKNEKICGNAEVIASATETPVIKMASDSKEIVTLSCTDGIQLTADKATNFIITVPPTEFKEGFVVSVIDSEGKMHEIKTQSGNTVHRSSILMMPSVTIKEGEDGIGAPIVIDNKGIKYVWDESVIPEITLSVSESEWNRLLDEFDQNNHTKEYIKCNVTYKKGAEVTEIIDAGIRLRGNTSRRRPEKGNKPHVRNNADWQHCHFGVNLRKFNKENEAIEVKDIKGIRKFNLKWFKDDPCYVRELFCYDLFRRAGIWTAAHATYCRLWIHVEGDDKPAYFGVYDMIEPYDNKYVEKREDLFGGAEGNLWKCSYDSHGPADLRDVNANMAEDNDKDDFTYELKETEDSFEGAKKQLQDFIRNINNKRGDEFYTWIKSVCDVDLLMRTYAVNVAVGMWDDLWNNGNNYYLYFNTSDESNYKVFFIPYDYDNTLGTCNCYDPATQDPYNWGDRGALMEKMMQYSEFKNIYRDELKRLVDPTKGLMDAESSIARILAWQSKIQNYLKNDTGEDMKIEDEPAGWGNWGNYNLMDWNNNYFVKKAQTINNLL